MSLMLSVVLFVGCALVIGVVGTRLTGVVDTLADRTGMGEAIAGAVLMGMATSLSGIVLSVTAAWNGQPELAMSNAVGGIAAQTLFLTFADAALRRVNLEHAAASIGNLAQGTLLMCLLGMLLVARYSPEWTLWGIHPVTPLLFLGYVYGLRIIDEVRSQPMWTPRRTRETREDAPDDEAQRYSLMRLWGAFAALALLLGVSGWVMEKAATTLAAETGMSQTAVGILLTSVATSLPELVTAVAAVRRGALTLAVGGIIGGNAFDTLFAAASDIAYRDGSIYHAVSEQTLLWIALSVLMTAVLLLGLVRREKHGPARIGFESVALVLLYGAGVAMVFQEAS
ncbi:cation:H+ antiporter [Chromohalobacter marismortui]|uniref:Cation:H+ antiporter n=1 Tax=Chromohalobacter marismortui TaxID=42055 RepID=A0A4R7NW94_9GAMM|nr:MULTISPECIES: sodium:calcium antiporter [Chromohalobacter]MCI0510483.1 sodium:calcium antiporter [Chromohalobacter sp.]MCI0594164.1 sodium:calcium antiporter [Chromohalobacter sp.]TDU24941.1 cation:H+ antiporter [Chromohalobacter marismortui]